MYGRSERPSQIYAKALTVSAPVHLVKKAVLISQYLAINVSNICRAKIQPSSNFYFRFPHATVFYVSIKLRVKSIARFKHGRKA